MKIGRKSIAKISFAMNLALLSISQISWTQLFIIISRGIGNE